MPEQNTEQVSPSPYVNIYIWRKQAERLRSLVQNASLGYPPSHPYWALLRNIDKALNEVNDAV